MLSEHSLHVDSNAEIPELKPTNERVVQDTDQWSTGYLLVHDNSVLYYVWICGSG